MTRIESANPEEEKCTQELDFSICEIQRMNFVHVADPNKLGER